MTVHRAHGFAQALDEWTDSCIGLGIGGIGAVEPRLGEICYPWGRAGVVLPFGVALMFPVLFYELLSP